MLNNSPSIPTIPTRELTGSQLKWGLWYVTHKLLLKKFFRIGLVGLSILLYSFSIWRLITFYIL